MKRFNVLVNGNHYEVEIEEVMGEGVPHLEQSPIQRAPTIPTPATDYSKYIKKPEIPKTVTSSESGEQETITSPMPGNIWKIMVEEGQEVKSGDIILILEAMKMENEILAPGDGKITKIITSEGAAVDTGDELVIFN